LLLKFFTFEPAAKVKIAVSPLYRSMLWLNRECKAQSEERLSVLRKGLALTFGTVALPPFSRF